MEKRHSGRAGVFFEIDRFDLEGEAQGAAKNFPPKVIVWPGVA
jgi:hypothetical protein